MKKNFLIGIIILFIISMIYFGIKGTYSSNISSHDVDIDNVPYIDEQIIIECDNKIIAPSDIFVCHIKGEKQKQVEKSTCFFI